MYLHVTPKSATVQNKMFESDIIATQMYFSIAFTYKWSQTRVSSTDLQVRTALQSLVKILCYSSYLNDHKEGITHRGKFYFTDLLQILEQILCSFLRSQTAHAWCQQSQTLSPSKTSLAEIETLHCTLGKEEFLVVILLVSKTKIKKIPFIYTFRCNLKTMKAASGLTTHLVAQQQCYPKNTAAVNFC